MGERPHCRIHPNRYLEDDGTCAGCRLATDHTETIHTLKSQLLAIRKIAAQSHDDFRLEAVKTGQKIAALRRTRDVLTGRLEGSQSVCVTLQDQCNALRAQVHYLEASHQEDRETWQDGLNWQGQALSAAQMQLAQRDAEWSKKIGFTGPPLDPDLAAKHLAQVNQTQAAMLADMERDRNHWKLEAEMFARAWKRELGNRLVPKTHLIDALVMTTQAIMTAARETFQYLRGIGVEDPAGERLVKEWGKILGT